MFVVIDLANTVVVALLRAHASVASDRLSTIVAVVAALGDRKRVELGVAQEAVITVLLHTWCSDAVPVHGVTWVVVAFVELCAVSVARLHIHFTYLTNAKIQYTYNTIIQRGQAIKNCNTKY